MKPIIKQLTDIIGSEPSVYGPKYRWQLSDMFDFTLYQKLSGGCVLTAQHVFDDARIANVDCNEQDVIAQAEILVRCVINTYELELQRVKDIHSKFSTKETQ